MQPLQRPLELIGCIVLYYFACCCLIYIGAYVVMPSFPAFCCRACLPFIYISLVYLLHRCLLLRQMDVSTHSKRHIINIRVPGRSHPGSTDRHRRWTFLPMERCWEKPGWSKEGLFQIQIYLFCKDKLFKSLRPSIRPFIRAQKPWRQTTINSAGNQINKVSF